MNNEIFIDIWDFFGPEDKMLKRYKWAYYKTEYDVEERSTLPFNKILKSWERESKERERLHNAEKALMRTLERQQQKMRGIHGRHI